MSSTSGQDGEETPKLPPVLINKGYHLKRMIGKGVYSTVWLGFNGSSKDRQLACKLMQIESLPLQWREKCMKLELKVLKRLKHPYIIRTHDLIKTRSTVFIFMDYHKNGSVFDQMQKLEVPFPVWKGQIWFAQILGAISYCHSKGVAHRDIKLDNFLLNDDFDCVLTDFGFATMGAHKTADIMRDTSCGHPAYMAPEVFDQTKVWPYEAKAADMWSMGVCLFEMLNFDKPFDPTLAVKNQLKFVMSQRNREYRFHSKVDVNLTNDIRQLVAQLLDPNPKTRITADDTLIHKGIVPLI